MIAQLERGHRKVFVSMVIDTDVAPAHGGDGVFAGDIQVGSVTSGGYGHRVKENIAFAFVNPDQSEIGNVLEVEILGERYATTVVKECRYDPDNLKVRS